MAKYTYSSIAPTVVSSSTSALASHNDRRYSPPSKTKSVSFLLHDTYDPRRRYSSDLARGNLWKHQVEDIATVATFPRHMVRRNIAYDRVKKDEFVESCACGSTPFQVDHRYANRTMTPERKYIRCAEMDHFRRQHCAVERSVDNCDDREGQAAEIHAVAIERLPACEICTIGNGVGLSENVYYIKDGVCENCACACSYSVSSSHFDCGRSFSPYESHQYAYGGCCEQKMKSSENSDEEAVVSSSGDVQYQSSSITLDGSRGRSFVSYTKLLLPCWNRVQVSV